MAVVHRTTMSPGKLELLAAWLPAQPWYQGTGGGPELARSGGFRLDDPRGETGIEFMVVTDGSDDQAASYLTPMTYRASALAGADGALIGTTEHGVLGRRWIYDGIGDPVLVGQLVALIQGQAQPQMQSVSDTPDPTVTCVPVAAGNPAAVESAVAGDGPLGAELRVGTAGGGGLVITVNRVLRPDDVGPDHGPTGEAGRGRISAPWRLPDGTAVRGCLAAARYVPDDLL